jgi:DNA-binding NarL/FixJ family response regulator
VREAENGVDVLREARDAPPDVFVLDEQLRDAPGREVVGWLRTNPTSRTAPIVLLGRLGHGSAGAPHDRGPTIEIHPRSSGALIRQTVRAALARARHRRSA